MKNKLFLLIAFVFLFSGIKANTCNTAVNVSVKRSPQADTLQIEATEMWISFTCDTTATFIINKYINNIYSGINQLDLYSGSCNSLSNLLSYNNTDSIIMFKYNFIIGNQYFIKLTRPSGLSVKTFSILGIINPNKLITNCNYTDCEYILNGGFNIVDPGMFNNPTFFQDANNLVNGPFCGWKNAWLNPNISGNNLNPYLHIWSTNTNGGEGVVTNMENRQLLQGHQYTLHYDYQVTTGSGVLNFVFSSLPYSNYPFQPVIPAVNTMLYLPTNPHYTFTQVTSTGSTWHHVDVQMPIMPTGVYLTMVIDPQSDLSTAFNIDLDNISITENPFTASITSNNATCNTLLTANYSQAPLNGPYSYLWNTNAETQSINVNTSGLYTVTITNGIGCTATAQYQFTVLPNNINLTMTSTMPTCGNCIGSINLTAQGGQAPYTYYWTGPNGFIATTEDLANLCIGTYTVTVTDANGCIKLSSLVITSSNIFSGASWPVVVSNTGGNEIIHDMVTDVAGNVYAIGTFTGKISFGSLGTFTNPQNYQYSIFVVKYNKCGIVEMARNYGGAYYVDNNKNYFIEKVSTTTIAVAGPFSKIDFISAGSPTMISTDGIDVFLALLNTNTLLATATTQLKISSNTTDNVKGLSYWSNAIYITGGYSGPQLNLGTFTPVLINSGVNSDLYIARFNSTLSSMNWAQNYTNVYSDNGMTMKVNGSLYFTYLRDNLSYISRVTPSNGVISATEQIGTVTDFYNINDMENIGNQLYLCGYKKSSYTQTDKKAAVIYYPAPVTSIAWNANNVRLSNNTNPISVCEATKIVTDGTNILTSGTFDQDNFRIGLVGLSLPANLNGGTTDHFVYKTDNVLTPISTTGWMSGVATGSGTSNGNALAYDATNSVYYLGGTFSGNFILTGVLGKTIVSAFGKDAYVARFQDNGMADYKSLEYFKDSLSKADNSNVIVYPNPSNGNFTIASVAKEGITNIIVSDLTGRIVLNKNFGNDIFETNTDLSFLPASTYFISVTTINNIYNSKLILVK